VSTAWAPARAAVNVMLTGVPDYDWHVGCFGTACGNLIGFWDRHGFPDFYTGPTAGGVAPLDAYGPNRGIRSLWATKAGQDGRPTDEPGHEENYYFYYEHAGPDPYVLFGRTEHAPDCIGDFIGLNQNKWKQLNQECDGNIDGYSFVYWDSSGQRRVNFVPGPEAGLPALDLQSGLRAWTAHRGHAADVFTQLSDFNPNVPDGAGFSFEDLRAEIDAGYPVLLFMQAFHTRSRQVGSMPRANPSIHGMLAYGYFVADDGTRYVRYRTSWANGDYEFSAWTPANWTPEGNLNLPLRGVIGFHPLPKIVAVERRAGQLHIRWHGPAAELYDEETGLAHPAHWYVLEQASRLDPDHFQPIAQPNPAHEATVPEPRGQGTAFFRVRLVPRGRN